jgi:Mycoplasma protein of unknown function, DUF285
MLKLFFVVFVLVFYDTSAKECRRWPARCIQHSECCNNQRCMPWDRCSLVHFRPSTTAYRCFETRDELKDAVVKYVEGNQTIKNIYGKLIGNWCVDYIQDFSTLFQDIVFNEDISKWRTSSAIDMHSMFLNPIYDQVNNTLNQDISRWDVSNVVDMSTMFAGATAFNQDLSSWNVENCDFHGWYVPCSK